MKNKSNVLFPLGQLLRRLSKTHGMTQTQLSELTGINDRYYQDIEYRKRNLSLDILMKILNVYKIDKINYSIESDFL